METQKIVNLLDATDNESSKFAARKWYLIKDQNNTEYGERNENDSTLNLRQKFVIIQIHIFLYLSYNSYRW